MKLLSSLFLISLVALPTACGGAAQEPATAETEATDAPPDAPTSNIVETAVAAGSFTTLVAAVQAAGLVETLSGPGPFTVFAPTDEAFKKLPPGTVDNLLKPENKEKLVAVLTYHVVPGNLMAKDVVGATSLKTVQGKDLTVMVNGSEVKINDALVIKTDIAASNGVIHVIDTVVLPN